MSKSHRWHRLPRAKRSRAGFPWDVCQVCGLVRMRGQSWADKPCPGDPELKGMTFSTGWFTKRWS